MWRSPHARCWVVVVAMGGLGFDARPLAAQERPPDPPSGPPVAASPEPSANPGVEPTRLFLAPTARTVARGDGSFGLTELVFPWAEVGLLDRVSVRTYVVPALADLSSAGIVLDPKLQLVRGRRVQAAVGFICGLASESGGAAYGVVTVGGRATSATVGLGYGFGSFVDSEGSRAVVFAGAEKAVSRGVRLIAEAYLGGAAFGLPEQTLIVGARLHVGRWSVDLGAVIPFYETGSGSAAPILTVARAF